MLGYTLLAIASALDTPTCEAGDGVCLLQFMQKEGMRVGRKEGLTIDELLDGGFNFAALNKDEGHGHKECPGEPIVGVANGNVCSKTGIEVIVDFNGKDIEDLFGDNVLMKHYKYYIENCDVHPCVDDELIDPAISGHKFKVGVTHVKVEGYDLAGNNADCTRTVNIYDEQPPIFSEPDSEVDLEITLEFPADSCELEAGEPFAQYDAVTSHAFTVATDNCDTEVTIVKQIHDASGTVVYDSSKDSVTVMLDLGPGTYTMEYRAIDGHSGALGLPAHVENGLPFDDVSYTTTVHRVSLHLKDSTPPYNFTGCPANQFVEIDAHETETHVDWIPPIVTGDNCEKYGTLPEAIEMSEPQKYPNMTLPVGSHMVRYSLEDASGNVYPEECIFEIEIMQKAHPVNVVCPEDVTVQTVVDMRSGIVHWPEPVATQGEVILDESHITYTQGVFSGMMFPFGVTSVHVNVTGEVTGTRTEEHLRYAECTFVVTVTDPFDPKVDGREYRCKNKDTTDIAPYRICDGPEVTMRLHSTYFENFGYDLLGVLEHDSLSCCMGEDDVVHECVPVEGSEHNKACKPTR